MLAFTSPTLTVAPLNASEPRAGLPPEVVREIDAATYSAFHRDLFDRYYEFSERLVTLSSGSSATSTHLCNAMVRHLVRLRPRPPIQGEHSREVEEPAV